MENPCTISTKTRSDIRDSECRRCFRENFGNTAEDTNETKVSSCQKCGGSKNSDVIQSLTSTCLSERTDQEDRNLGNMSSSEKLCTCNNSASSVEENTGKNNII